MLCWSMANREIEHLCWFIQEIKGIISNMTVCMCDSGVVVIHF